MIVIDFLIWIFNIIFSGTYEISLLQNMYFQGVFFVKLTLYQVFL